MEENESKDTVKVVDKRRFTEEGELREGEDNSEERIHPVAEGASASGKAGAESAKADPEDKTEEADSASGPSGVGEIEFSSFVIGLYTQALIMLGEIPNPETNQASVNLDAARQTIDILGMLEGKTRGNLSEDEVRLLTDVLDRVRMTYVGKLNSGGKDRGNE